MDNITQVISLFLSSAALVGAVSLLIRGIASYTTAQAVKTTSQAKTTDNANADHAFMLTVASSSLSNTHMIVELQAKRAQDAALIGDLKVEIEKLSTQLAAVSAQLNEANIQLTTANTQLKLSNQQLSMLKAGQDHAAATDEAGHAFADSQHAINIAADAFAAIPSAPPPIAPAPPSAPAETVVSISNPTSVQVTGGVP